MGQELEVEPDDLKKASKDYADESDRTAQDGTYWASSGRLDPDVWGRLPESYKMANNYDEFYNQVVQDLTDIGTYLSRFADKLEGAAKSYEKMDKDNTITVKPGDTLSGIAKNNLGNANRWPEIAKNNPQIKDPNRIYPGDKIKLPRPER